MSGGPAWTILPTLHMRRTDGTGRSTSLAATATTLVALAALAAVAPSVQGAPMARLASAEALGVLGESQAMRAVVAVMAAAARDLLAGQPTPATLPEALTLELCGETAGIVLAGPTDDEPGEGLILAERLLDLPPPRC